MAAINESDYDFLCRTCLKVLKQNKSRNRSVKTLSYNLFSDSDFLDKFLACTRLFAEINDGLPEIVCEDCYDKINEFYDFQKLCKTSENKLCEMKFSECAPPSSRALWQHFNAEDEAPIYDWQIETDQNKLEIIDVSQVCRTETSSVSASASASASSAAAKIKVEAIDDETYCSENDVQPLFKRERGNDNAFKDNVNNKNVNKTNWDDDADSSNDCNNQEDDDFEASDSSVEFDSEEDDDMSDSDYEKSKKAKNNKRKNKKESEDNESDSDQEDDAKKGTKNPPKKKRIKNRNPIPITFYNCDICAQRFVIQHKLVAHKRVHEGLVPYPCTYPECKRGFKHRHSLDVHLKKHTGSNIRFKCREPDCGKSYTHKLSLRWHMRKVHGEGPQVKKHCCETCGKCFGTGVALGDHIYTHGNKADYPFACEYENCGMRFIKKEKLNIHMMRHAGIKNFVCPHCGMRKTTREELTIHINYHTHERTYRCELCPKVFTNPGNLKNHIRVVHEGIRDYVCRFCGQTFSTSESCKYHENIHTGEKPFECSNCGQRFAQPGSLRSHKKRCLRTSDKNEQGDNSSTTKSQDESITTAQTDVSVTSTTLHQTPTSTPIPMPTPTQTQMPMPTTSTTTMQDVAAGLNANLFNHATQQMVNAANILKIPTSF